MYLLSSRSTPIQNIGAAIGLQGEYLVLEGFARQQFVLVGRETRSYRDRVWTATEHDLDFIFERDGIAYGVEVKNTLGYMDHDELQTKIRLCLYLGIRPLFAVRMLPKTWANEVIRSGGFALILKCQLYPFAHRQLAQRVRQEFGLPSTRRVPCRMERRNGSSAGTSGTCDSGARFTTRCAKPLVRGPLLRASMNT